MFTIHSIYTKRDIYDKLKVPADKQGGHWDTGYAKYEGSFYIFVNVGVAGRTGHDYENKWVENNKLHWVAKNNAKWHHALIQELIHPQANIHVFTRENDREAFKYAGIAKLHEKGNGEQVQVTWSFGQLSGHDADYGRIDVEEAWIAFVENARHSKEIGETFNSPVDNNKYQVESVSDSMIKVLRVDRKTIELITKDTFTKSIGRINKTTGPIPQYYLHERTTIEAAYVWLLPQLDWDKFKKNILIDEININIKDAKNDLEIAVVEILKRIRSGQNKLRENLFVKYNGKCCITGCSIKEALDACHIFSHAESGDNSTANALLLRSDIHSLWDVNLIGIHPETLEIHVSTQLADSEYYQYHGKNLARGIDLLPPNKDYLAIRWEKFIA